MATRTMTATRQTDAAPRLDAARAQAIALCAAAYAPQPVAQPDGTSLMLCWAGRIARAYELLAAARIARDTPRIEVIQAAIAGLEQKRSEAVSAAENAASTWAAIAAASGTPANLNECYPAQCQCEGCRAQMAWHDHNEARGAYSDALYRLLAPNSDDLPPLLQMMQTAADDKNQRDRLWGYLKHIYDTGNAYIDACKAADVRPNWRAALFPGENS